MKTDRSDVEAHAAGLRYMWADDLNLPAAADFMEALAAERDALRAELDAMRAELTEARAGQAATWEAVRNAAAREAVPPDRSLNPTEFEAGARHAAWSINARIAAFTPPPDLSTALQAVKDAAVRDALIEARNRVAERRNKCDPGPVFGAYNEAMGDIEDVRSRALRRAALPAERGE